MPNRLSEQTVGRSAPVPEARDVPALARNAAGLTERLLCPCCRSDSALVVETSSPLYCSDCDTRFPVISNGEALIPWLFRSPDVARLEWSARYKGFLNRNALEHNRLNRAMGRSRSSSAAKQRIKVAIHAHREHRNQVESLLAPLGLDGDVLVPAVTKTLHDKLPKNQGLTSYSANVFRDWAWNNGENDALLNAVEEVLGADCRESIGSTLTLGAGACRLSYDIHQKYAPTSSVVLDFNPLLLLIGCKVIHGDVVPLYEFPYPALEEGVSGVLQHCHAPTQLSFGEETNFQFVFGDATNPPFRSQSFDTIMTPWLIDIIPMDIKDFVPQVNRLLPVDGIWLNTGSLAFFHEDPLRCYSESEVLEIVESSGFEIVAVDHRTVPYLQSPHSAHGRNERITSFIARKIDDVDSVPTPTNLPEWLLDVTRPVPSSPERVVESSSHLLTAQVIAAIDGKRSITAIAQMVAREYDLSMDECVHAVSRILCNSHEDPFL